MRVYSQKFKLEPEEKRREFTEEELKIQYKKSTGSMVGYEKWVEKGLKEDFLRLISE